MGLTETLTVALMWWWLRSHVRSLDGGSALALASDPCQLFPAEFHS